MLAGGCRWCFEGGFERRDGGNGAKTVAGGELLMGNSCHVKERGENDWYVRLIPGGGKARLGYWRKERGAKVDGDVGSGGQ